MIYFISDAHLGSHIVKDKIKHEQKLVRWLESVRHDAKLIVMVGDMFDFWFEYKTVVPKGYVRFLGKVAELVDSGIEIKFFIGNHDIWTFGYLEKELGVKVYKKPTVFDFSGKKFFVHHGDGLQLNGDKKFLLLRKIFHSRIAQKLFGIVPPRIGQSFGYNWSKSNRKKTKKRYVNKYEGEDNEYLVQFAKDYITKHNIDYFVFGHRHIDLFLQLKNRSHLVILGDFIEIFSYGKFDGENFSLEYFERE
ncbi:MAG: UDP-2,3-diacylglucosamine hydrolase [Paludibacter sp.]|nr:MAG: UDP-2,3-diacylglucosamine hydrolase [Paludibacter sp.]